MGRRLSFAIGVAALGCLSNCLDPTEMVLVLGTDVNCTVVTSSGVSIALGAPGNDNSGVVTSTEMCSSDGGIGTLVVVPSQGDDQTVGIRVTLGVDVLTQNCHGPLYTGCIVARRSLRYVPHHPLTLPIDLDESCLDQPCDPNSTCVSGQCVDAGIGDCGTSGVCLPPNPSDAGACQVVPPTLIAPTSATVGTPRIAKTSTGYVVAWLEQGSVGPGINAVAVSPLGIPSSVVALAQALPASTALGPLGSDGQTYGLLYGDPSAGTVTGLTYDTLSMLGQTSPAIPPAFVPLGGIFNDGTHYVSATYSTQATGSEQFVTFDAQNTFVNAGAIERPGPTNVSFAADGTTYYLAVTDITGCEVDQCTNTYICPTIPLYSSSNQGCNGVRVAAANGEAIIPTLFGGQNLGVDFFGPTTASYAMGTADGPEAFVPLAGSVPHLLWWTGGTLFAAAFVDLASMAPPTPIALDQRTPDAGQTTAATVDAVNDGPSVTSYAAVYWGGKQGTGVYFVHECQ